jgi:hypothetical protein
MTLKFKIGLLAGLRSCVLAAALTLSCSQLKVDVPPDAIAGASQRSDAAGAIDAPIGSQGTTISGGGGGPSNDAANCGPSAHDCTRLANVRVGAPVQCQDGHCVVPTTSCVEGYGHCTLNPDDGCETNLTRAESCGACGVACSGTAALCASVNGKSQCTNTCGTVTPDMCGASCTNLQTDPENCGTCGQSCSFPNTQAKCVAGHCAVATCNAGFADCNANPGDGCEASLSRAETCGSCTVSCSGTSALCANMGGRFQCTSSCAPATPDNCGTVCANLQTDAENCGKCGQLCGLPNAQARCVAGSCAVASCNPGFADCNSTPADGCEASLSRPETCGSCTVSCSGTTMLCANMSGRFQCANSCSGTTPNNCGAQCANLQTDAQNCGTCGHVCSLPNAQARCVAGSCAVASCNAGFGDCNSTPADGCEANLSRPQTCGSCTVSCSGTMSLCANMGGRFQCANSCTGATPDNCPTRCANLQTDVQNCGSCGHLCSVPNAQARCVAGSCGVSSCNAGFGDCNLNGSDGCEVAIRGSDINNCGGCGIRCTIGDPICVSGTCTPTCGGNGQPCCGGQCSTSNLSCQAGQCKPCGGNTQVCCPGNNCGSANLVCTNPLRGAILNGSTKIDPLAVCQMCGGTSGVCCPGFRCNPGLFCIETAGFYCLSSCGQAGEGCCLPDRTCTNPALHCSLVGQPDPTDGSHGPTCDP